MINKIVNFIRMPYRDDSLFGIILISLFVTPLFFLPILEDLFETPRFVASLVFAGLCLIVFFFRKTAELRFSKTLAVVLILFAVLNIVSAIFGQDFYNGIIGIYGRFANSIVFVILWTALIFLIGLQNSQEKVLVLMKAFLVSGFLVAVLGILHSYEILFYFGVENTERAIIPSFIGNQNFSAMFLVGIIPFLFPILQKTETILQKTKYFVLGAVMVWALMIFASRGAILAFAVAIVVGLLSLFLRKIEWKHRLAVLGVIALSVFFAFFFYSTTRLEETAGSLNLQTNVSAQARIIVWAESAGLALNNPVLGLGPGNFYIGFRSLGNTTLPGSERFDDAHNLFIHTAVSTGIPSVVLFLLMALIPLYGVAKNYYITGSLVSWGIMISFIGLLISFSFSPVNISLWFLLAFLIAASQFMVPPKFYEDNKIPISIKRLSLVLGVLLIIIGGLFMTSELYTRKTKSAYRSGNFQDAYESGKIASLANPINSIARLYTIASMIKLDDNPEIIRSRIDSFTGIHSNSSGTQRYAGDLHFMLYDKTNDQKDLEKGFGHIEKERQLEPNFPPVLINQAYVYYKYGNYELSKTLLNQVVTQTSQGEYYFAWLLLAQIHLEENRLDLMAEALRKANSIQPSLILDGLIGNYERGEFTLEKLPIYFPDIDV